MLANPERQSTSAPPTSGGRANPFEAANAREHKHKNMKQNQQDHPPTGPLPNPLPSLTASEGCRDMDYFGLHCTTHLSHNG
ncbi:hypothetical protein VULLAG_LOCUS2398 [Vulpes lagopus]